MSTIKKDYPALEAWLADTAPGELFGLERTPAPERFKPAPPRRRVPLTLTVHGREEWACEAVEGTHYQRWSDPLHDSMLLLAVAKDRSERRLVLSGRVWCHYKDRTNAPDDEHALLDSDLETILQAHEEAVIFTQPVKVQRPRDLGRDIFMSDREVQTYVARRLDAKSYIMLDPLHQEAMERAYVRGKGGLSPEADMYIRCYSHGLRMLLLQALKS